MSNFCWSGSVGFGAFDITRAAVEVKVNNIELTYMGLLDGYTITASSGSNGSIDPEGDVYVAEGSSKTFNATPDSGYVVDRWYVDGQDVGGGISSILIQNVQADRTVLVTFKLSPPPDSETVTLTANKDTYVKEGNPTLNFGSSSTLRVTTDTLDNYGLINFNLNDIPNGSQ
ncbi:MAG: hypothetical protein JRD93_18550 [Deltaproteobacteria bacterium]|nr:hypothetical protein [Deltaproteobacteria bacterium]